VNRIVKADKNLLTQLLRCLGSAYMDKKQYESAALEMQKAIALDRKPMMLTNLGELYAIWGKRKEALEIIAQLQVMSKQQYVAPSMVALVYVRLGDKAAALHWLKKARPDDELKLTGPGFESLRSEPEFKMLEARLKPDSACPAF
jgi:tetratricopeptide (TPR) repeat protein